MSDGVAEVRDQRTQDKEVTKVTNDSSQNILGKRSSEQLFEMLILAVVPLVDIDPKTVLAMAAELENRLRIDHDVEFRHKAEIVLAAVRGTVAHKQVLRDAADGC